MKKVSVIVAAALLSAVFLFDAQSTGQTKY